MKVNMIPWCVSSLLLAGIAPCTLRAQQTLLVGPGMPFADVQSAINASAPGDTIGVRPHAFGFAYSWCTVAHSLTIRSDPPGGPRAEVDGVLANLAAGSHLHLQDIGLGQAQVAGGLATFEGVDVAPTVLAVTFPVLVVSQSSVVFRRHHQFGTAQINGSAIAAVDSTFHSPSAFATPGPAVVLNQSTGFFSHCLIGCISPYAGSMGLRVNAGSRADLVDCRVVGVPNPAFAWPGMPTVVVDAGGMAREHRSIFDDGNGVATGIVGLVQPHVMLGASLVETQLLVGGSMNVQFLAQPLDLVFVLAAFRLDPPTPVPLVEPEQWGFAANGFLVTALLADGVGLATFSITFPNSPNLQGAGVWLTGASGLTFPLPLSVPVGGLLQ